MSASDASAEKSGATSDLDEFECDATREPVRRVIRESLAARTLILGVVQCHVWLRKPLAATETCGILQEVARNCLLAIGLVSLEAVVVSDYGSELHVALGLLGIDERLDVPGAILSPHGFSGFVPLRGDRLSGFTLGSGWRLHVKNQIEALRDPPQDSLLPLFLHSLELLGNGLRGVEVVGWARHARWLAENSRVKQ
jgi:hypothetical protein